MPPKSTAYFLLALGVAALVQGQGPPDGVRAALARLPTCTTTCGEPVRDVGRFIFIEEFTLLAISSIAIILRLIFKAFDKSPDMSSIGMDDVCIFAAYAILVPKTYICGELIVNTGLGRDVWTLDIVQLTKNSYYWYIVTPMYFAASTLVKSSLLFFFMRIFTEPGGHHTRLANRWDLRRALVFTLATTLVTGLAFVVVSVFQCAPISYYWTRVDGLHTGKCFKIGDFIWANAIIGIVIDFWMLYLPLSQVRRLNMSRSKKFSVVFSIIRLHSLVTSSRDNSTWDAVGVMVWSSLELHTGVVCACMPALRAVLFRTIPATARRVMNRQSVELESQETRSQLSDNSQVGKAAAWTPGGSSSKDEDRGTWSGPGDCETPDGSYSQSVLCGASWEETAGRGGAAAGVVGIAYQPTPPLPR
ncbi:uncharacterized protein PpBr36_09921 [Pyricularia pennisetigena]|uniref:uncharacterized protein n=1 Tax=Pyricularia pennisetigena TaxID=1578925 RepID=UPI001153B4B9|nr:uncharacterized protein PpBr36_09921 [Pyricularia pennisetigena]TLS22378.1 hypothetical protein PpBr36_09921 [Pyricularia pennisetigena]